MYIYYIYGKVYIPIYKQLEMHGCVLKHQPISINSVDLMFFVLICFIKRNNMVYITFL